MLKIIGFDLDNTLYDHAQYVEAAYRDISKLVSKAYGLDYSVYFNWIFERWKQKGSSYNRIFEESYMHFSLNGFHKDIKRILEIYHSAEPNLTTYSGVIEILSDLSLNYKIVIITDGSARTQNYKIDKLGLRPYVDKVYISGDFGKDFYKPSEKLFKLCIDTENVAPQEMLYIGDHPCFDYEPCKKLGIRFIRLIKGEYCNYKSSESMNIYDIYELKTLINNLNRVE